MDKTQNLSEPNFVVILDNWSCSNSDNEEECNQSGAAAAASEVEPVPPVWSLDCSDRLVVVGCANGRIEVWEARTGAFRLEERAL